MIEVDNTIFVISVVFQIASGIAIIFLLAIQSWVLVKLLPEIKEVSKNSTAINKITPKNFKEFASQFTDSPFPNCTNPSDPYHIHTEACK